MKTFSYNGSAEQYIEVVDYVKEHYQEAVITCVERESAVVLPLFEYKPFRETMRLMISRVNAPCFIASVARIESQKSFKQQFP